MTSSRTLRAAAAGLVAGVVLAGCGSSSPAPTLNATGPKAFTYDVVHRRFAGAAFASSKKSDLLSLGQALCASLTKGRTASQVDAGLVDTKSIGATADEDEKFLTTAIVTLCPQYAGQILASAGTH